MAEHWQVPVREPLFTDSLLTEWVKATRESGRKARAFDTRLRFSDAGACTRSLAYSALTVEPTEPMDPPGVWVTSLGTMIHELLQAAIGRRFPDAQFEVKGIIESVTSGHCDAVVDTPDARWLFELKTVGGFAFDKAIGLNRKGYKLGTPEGPRRSAVLQAGINAIAHGCQMVAVGYVAMEAVSVQLAAKTGLRHIDRILAEWHIPEQVWRPMAEAEITRQMDVLATVDNGALPAASAPEDDGSTVALNPHATRVHWRCNYCAYRSRCEQDGAGIVPIPVEIRRAS